MRTTLHALLLALVLAMPLASAHIEGFSQARTINVGPYLVYLQPQPDVIFANTTLSMSAQIARNDTGASARGVGATLLVGGPNEFNKTLQMREDRQGNSLIAAVLLPQRGNYTFRVTLQDANGTHAADTEIEAYPDLPFRIRSADTTQDVYVGQKATLRFEVVNRTTLRPADPFQDLTIRFEHWDDAHTQLLSEHEAPLTRAQEGVWTIDHTFTRLGMFHMKFASEAGGFTYSDVPILHLYATNPPRTDDVEEKPVPAPAAGLVLLAVALGIVLRRRA